MSRDSDEPTGGNGANGQSERREGLPGDLNAEGRKWRVSGEGGGVGLRGNRRDLSGGLRPAGGRGPQASGRKRRLLGRSGAVGSEGLRGLGVSAQTVGRDRRARSAGAVEPVGSTPRPLGSKGGRRGGRGLTGGGAGGGVGGGRWGAVGTAGAGAAPRGSPAPLTPLCADPRPRPAEPAVPMAMGAPPEDGAVAVMVRVRPAVPSERDGAARPVLHVVDQHILVFDPEEPGGPPGAALPARGPKHRGKDLKFVFDRVFGEGATQEEVFQHTTREVLDGVLNGYNCSGTARGGDCPTPSAEPGCGLCAARDVPGVGRGVCVCCQLSP